MADDDLIRRGDARRVMLAYASSYSAEQAETAIAALPAQRVRVRALEWECTDWSAGDGVQGENDCEWEAHVSDWRYMIEWLGRGEFRVTMPDDTDASAESLEAAKAAAQADYEARILAALTPAPADEVRRAALMEAAAVCAEMADQTADAALTGLPEQARVREAMEAALTKARYRILALIEKDTK